MLLVSVVAVVSESDVGVEGVGMYDPVESRLLSVAAEGMDIEGDIETMGVPIVR